MADQAKCAPNPASEEHQHLVPFIGTFRAEVRLWMGPGEPSVSTGVMVNTLELGGRFLQQVYRGDATDGAFAQFEGRGYWGFNSVTRKYEGFWIDTASDMMQIEAGEVDPARTTWTMCGEVTNPQTGQPMKKRSVITLVDADHHTMETYFAGPDGQEFKAMEIAYVRAS